ncbi:MAG: hypothetical protein ACQET3_04755 [Promethearchaeati archaeon]
MAKQLSEFNMDFHRLVELKPEQLDSTVGPVFVDRQISIFHGPERGLLTEMAHIAALGGVVANNRSLYLDSGSGFSPNLMRKFGETMEADRPLEHIQIGNVFSLTDLEAAVEHAGTHGFRVVIVDSLTGVMNLSGKPMTKKTQRKLYSSLEKLRAQVNNHGLHLMMTAYSSKGARKPVGGNVLAHAVDSVIRIEKLDVSDSAIRILVQLSPLIKNERAVVVYLSPCGLESIYGGFHSWE